MESVQGYEQYPSLFAWLCCHFHRQIPGLKIINFVFILSLIIILKVPFRTRTCSSELLFKHGREINVFNKMDVLDSHVCTG